MGWLSEDFDAWWEESNDQRDEFNSGLRDKKQKREEEMRRYVDLLFPKGEKENEKA